MHLNGEEALAYARMRKQDKRGDFGRNDRQKQILKAALDQISKPQNLAKIDTIAQKQAKTFRRILESRRRWRFNKFTAALPAMISKH